MNMLTFINTLRTGQNTNPSISARSWLMVWREYGCMGDSIRFPPTLSNSSIKITQGALAFASSAGKRQQKYVFLWKNKTCRTIIFIELGMQHRQGCIILRALHTHWIGFWCDLLQHPQTSHQTQNLMHSRMAHLPPLPQLWQAESFQYQEDQLGGHLQTWC